MSYLRILIRTATLVETGFIDHLLTQSTRKAIFLRPGTRLASYLRLGMRMAT